MHAGFEITADHVAINDRQEIAYDRRKSRVSNLKKQGKSFMTADHHERELWDLGTLF